MELGKRSEILCVRGEICKGIVIGRKTQPVHDGKCRAFCGGLPHVTVIVLAFACTAERQVCPVPFTDVLYYAYENWRVKITASENCPDLMDRLTQDELDRANLKCRDTYRPALITRDGLPVLDQVDSLDGYCELLKAIHPNLEALSPDERKKAEMMQHDKLAWAKSQGWQRDDSTDINFL